MVCKIKYHEKVQNACRKGRAALHRLVGIDMAEQCRKLNPWTLVKLYKSVVIPKFCMDAKHGPVDCLRSQ